MSTFDEKPGVQKNILRIRVEKGRQEICAQSKEKVRSVGDPRVVQ